MRRKWVELAVLAGVPVFTVVLAGTFQYWSAFREDPYFRGFTTIITGAAAVTAILAIAMAVYIVFDRKRAEEDDEKTEFKNRAETLQRRLADQTREIELLAAMREVGLIVSKEVDFEKILAGVVEVVDGLFSPDSITIFLTEPLPEAQGIATIPKFHMEGGKMSFGDSVPEDVDRPGVDQACRDRIPVRSVEVAAKGTVDCALPLVADEDVIGVMRLTIAMPTGNVDEFDEVERDLVKLVRHIALAIKTPTLYDRAVVDALTGLYTKRHFTEVLTKLVYQSVRLNKPLSMVMIDIDHFKNFNDTYGHITGDLVLAGVSEVIMQSVRRYDTVYRYGGEELAIILPDAKITAAQRVARRVRKAVEEKVFHADRGEEVAVTVSCGVATWAEGMKDLTALVGAADGALYEAKEKGRNRVVTAKGRDNSSDVSVQST